ncbi:MAG: ABC transporter substrate-binding protein [Monoglobales bacterium]
MKKLAVILLVIFLCGCSNTQSPSGDSSPDKTERAVALNNKIINMYAIRENDLNPLMTSNESGRLMLSLVFRPLVTVGQNFDCTLSLAAQISPSPDCTSYDIILKNDILWDDGSPFTSSDVEYTVRKIMEYEETSPYFDNLRNVTGYGPSGTHGYTFVLEKSDSGFPFLLNFPIVKNGSLENGVNTVGTGDYILKDYKDFTSYSLIAKSPKGEYHVDRINVTLLPDGASAYSSYKLGKINILKLSSDDASAYSIDGKHDFISTNTNRYTFLAVNHYNKNLSDPAVRRLIAKILSQENVIKDLMPEFAVHADSFVNPSSYFAVKNNANYGDIKEAFDKIGYIADESGVRAKSVEGGKRKLSLDILVNGDNPAKVIAAEYISNLLGTYGISTSITKPDYNSYIDALVSQSFDLALCETIISLNNDYTFLMGTEGSANLGGYSSERADYLLSSISSSSDKTARVDNFKKLQTLFFEDMPHIPLWFQTSKIIYNSAVFKELVSGNITDEFSSISTWTIK